MGKCTGRCWGMGWYICMGRDRGSDSFGVGLE